MTEILTAFSFETVKVGNKAQKLTSAVFAPADGLAERAFVTCEGEIRYKYCGGDPLVDEGHLLRDGGFLILKGELQIRNFKAISTGTEEAILSVSYERK